MPQMKEVVESLKLSSSVDFLGFCSHDRVREELKREDIFLAPHVTARNGDKEGIPNTIKEAMATGLPVISTYHAGIPELVEDGKSGFLVKEKDVDGLAYYLDKLVENPELREEMGRRGRKIVIDRFSLERGVEELEKIYESNVKRI
jgi:glycosyltransferase involved in cell wall biosynthesis